MNTATLANSGEQTALHTVAARIRTFRRRMNLTQAQLAAKVGIHTGPLNALEKGHHLPSTPVLYRLGRVLGVPIDAFFGPAVNGRARYLKEDGAAYGSLLRSAADGQAAPIVHLDANEPVFDHASLDMLDRLVHAFLTLEDVCGAQKSANIPLRLACPSTEAGLHGLVQRVRYLLGVGDAVLFDYLELIENAGLRVLFVPLPKKVESTSCYDTTVGNAFLFVSTGMNVERQLFRLLYELGRIYLFTSGVRHVASVKRGKLDAAQAARKFAALFLMPAEAVHATVKQLGIEPDAWSYELLLRIKHRFGVSAQSFLYRLDELDLITATRLREIDARIAVFYKKTRFGEPDSSRRILTPNGRFGDLLQIAAQNRDAAVAKEIEAIEALVKRYGIKTP